MGDGLDIGVLGPLRLRRDGATVDVTRGRCRAVLAYLVTRHPDGASVDAVAHAIWPDATDGHAARNSVRVHASHLRSVAAPAQILPRRTRDYRLLVRPEQLDITRFLAAARDGRELAAGGRTEDALRRFERATHEWRGEPFAGLDGYDAFRAPREALVTEWLDLMADYSDALLEHDWADEAARLLRPVVDTHPLHEHLAATLMRALLRSDRRHEALDVHAHVRAALRDAHGVAPGRELTELLDAAIADPDPPTVRSPVAVRPAAPGRRRPSLLVGRSGPLAELDAAWDRAQRGAPQLVLVTGGEGMGKTTLLEHFVGGLDDVDAVVGCCDPDPSDRYQPFPELVRAALRTSALADTPPDALAELARLSPDLETDLPRTGPAPDRATGRQRLLDAVTRVVAQTLRPRVVVLDDLHWSGADAVAMLRHMVRLASGQVLVVLSFRADRLEADHPLRVALATGRLSRPDASIELAPMSRAEVRAMVDLLAPPDARRHRHRQVDELRAVTVGEPLRIVEALRHLEDHPEAEIADIAPDDLRTLVRRRLATLPSGVSRVLRAAAVVGSTVRLDAVAETAAVDADTALAALERAVDEGYMREVAGGTADIDRFEWTRPFYRNAVYHDTTRSRRARLHLRLGQRLVRERAGGGGGPASEPARHHLAAGPLADPDTTLALVMAAGADAVARYARQEAVEWFRLARDLDVPTHAQRQARLALGRSLAESGARGEAESELLAVAADADAAADTDLLVEAVLALGPESAILDRAVAGRLATAVDRALDRLDGRDERRAAVLRVGALARTYHDPESAEAHRQAIEDLAASSDDPRVQAMALSVRHARDEHHGLPNVALARAARDHSLAHALRDLEPGDDRRLLNDLLRTGELAEFDRVLAAATDRARETRSPFHLYWCAALTATRAMTRSCDETVEDLVNGAASRGLQLEIGDARGMQMLQLFALRYQQGRSAETTQGLRAPAADEPQVVAGLSLLALTFATAGRADEARTILDRAVTDTAILLPRDNFRDGAIALFGATAALVGRPRQRALLRRALESMHVTLCVFGSGGAVFGTPHHWLGELARADGDDAATTEHLTTAARVCDTAGATYWADRARAAAGRGRQVVV
jgi:DNA-binding SARP family transcriptional activator